MDDVPVIDMFNHIFPSGYLSELARRCPNLAFKTDSRTSAVKIFNTQTGVFVAYSLPNSVFDTPEKRLEDMDAYGVYIQVLSASLPAAEPSLLSTTPENVVAIAKFINDSIAKIVEKHSDRFLGAAEVPVVDENAALEEFDRAVNDLGMKCIQLYTQMAGLPLDHEMFHPLFERAVKYDVPILLHPNNPPPTQRRGYEHDYSLSIVFGWPYETTLALSRLVLSGVLEKFPTLKIVSHHMGGMVAHFSGRLQILESLLEGWKYRKKLLDYFKMFYVDTVLGGYIQAAKCGYEIFGPDHIVFGSDYPFGPENGKAFIRQAKDVVKGLSIPETEQAKILYKNAKKLLRIH
ncbi:MAG: amidohydrolase family protein [Candidatus Caldarchaeum sp.]|nr:amidohydrolase family protein [Candidatus Caldarchaeum sp.]